MKFWKSLSNLIEETLPDWRDKFLSYKDLKKQLKQICPAKDGGGRDAKRQRIVDRSGREVEGCSDGGDEATTRQVNGFVRGLEEEVEKFNAFFVDQEEEYVIKWKELQDMVKKAKDSPDELMKVGREIVDLHGEMVLLMNYSALNYTGLVKILKKHDKRSGTLIMLPFIQKVLREPFFSPDLLNQLVKECETTMLKRLFSVNEPPPAAADTIVNEPLVIKTANGKGKRTIEVPKELSEIEHMESMYGRLTLSALRVLKEIRGPSSTLNPFSLHPLQANVIEADWKYGTSCQVVDASLTSNV